MAGLDRTTKALLAYAEKLTTDPGNCGPSDIAVLRQNGWDDRAIHDATQVVSYFNYINRIADGLGVDDESWMTPTRAEWLRRRGRVSMPP